MGTCAALLTKLGSSFCCESETSSQVPLTDREPHGSFKCDMEDSGMLVAEEPDGCLDELPPHTCAGVKTCGARVQNIAVTHLPTRVQGLEAI